jgi:DNA-binding response OmpR family regulator
VNGLPDIGQAPRARILIVEETQPVRCLLVEILKHHGYRVDLAGSAREALLLAQTGWWDAVVISFGLPDMQGVELYTRLHRDCGRECLPLIFVHGYSRQKLLHALQSTPRASLPEKLFGVRQFLSTLEECLQNCGETK